MNKRNSNIEILRIISMILIIMHHFSTHGMGDELTYSFNRYVIAITNLGGKLGATLFVLVSGYYMCKSKITGRKLAKLFGEVFFYSSSIFLIFFLMNRGGIQTYLNN